MRWDDFRRSDNVEDDREGGGGLVAAASASPAAAAGSASARSIVLGLIGWATGIDPSILIGGAEMLRGGGSSISAAKPASRRARPARRRIRPANSSPPCSAIPKTSGAKFSSAMGKQYRAPRLRLFRGGEQGGCGFAQAAMGPFYCPSDQRIYLDTSFFRDMQVRFHGCSGKACEFAEAYVIAHEVGHHVQNLLGILPKAQRRAARRRQQGGGQPHPGAHRIAGRLLRRRLGQPLQPALEVDRAGRCRGRAADRLGHRRRPAAEAVARLRRARRLHPRLIGAAPALVHHRAERGQGVVLRHLRGGSLELASS